MKPILCFTLFILVWRLASAMPPPNPIRCTRSGCTLRNSYGLWPDRNECNVSSAAYPTNEAELRAAVAHAARNNLRAKPVSGFSHTIPKFACPGPAIGGTLLISTARYDAAIHVDVANRVVTADAGVGLRALIDRVEGEGLSLAAAPYWEGVSVGGAISTGAHGSSWRGRGGALHDHVVGIRVVVPARESDGFAKVLDLRGGDPLFDAVRVSLGTVGLISKVTFSLEPGFKRSITYNFTNDDGIEDEFMEHAKRYEFGDIQWYPSKREAVYRYDDRVPLNTSGDGVNDFLGFQSTFSIIAKSIRASEKAAEKARSAEAKCALAASFLAYKKLTANGLKNNKLIFTGYPVVGRQGQMQTSGSCLYSHEASKLETCPWDPRIEGLSFYESTAIFPHTKFGDFIRDVKRLRDAIKPESFCGADLYNGFLIRFIKKSKAYLGQDEDSVVVDFNYFRADEKWRPRLNQDVYEEIEQMAFFKYGARPHWGKNRNVGFIGVRNKYADLGKFVRAKKVLDPENVFSSDWSDEILFGDETRFSKGKEDGCALEGECVCSEDIHCSPENGYFCRSGRVYDKARVCRYSSSSSD